MKIKKALMAGTAIVLSSYGAHAATIKLTSNQTERAAQARAQDANIARGMAATHMLYFMNH